MKIHLRIDESNPSHTRFTIFANGANCGQLCMRNEEFHNFHQILSLSMRPPIDTFVSSGKPYLKPEERGESA